LASNRAFDGCVNIYSHFFLGGFPVPLHAIE
jgi:hypothetical protein